MRKSCFINYKEIGEFPSTVFERDGKMLLRAMEKKLVENTRLDSQCPDETAHACESLHFAHARRHIFA